MREKSRCLIAAFMLAALAGYGQTKPNPESDFEVDLNASGDGAVITKYVGNSTTVVIPVAIQGFPVREIRGAFEDCTSLVSVVIPEGVTAIGEAAFSGCESLVTVNIAPIERGWGYDVFEGSSKVSLASRDALKKAGYAGGF